MGKAGRPVKDAQVGTRVSLGLKVTAAMKARIDAEAKASGRTQSQQAELLLEKALAFEQILNLLSGAPPPETPGGVK